MSFCPKTRLWARSSQLTAKQRNCQKVLPRQQLHRQIHASRTAANSSASDSTPALRFPDPPSKEHCDVPSYTAYAERVGLDTSSTTYVGTHYEYTVAATLEKFGFHLRRVGGAGDYGIDLLGTWSVPSTPTPLRVLLQCKASSITSKARIGPATIRELEGAFVGAPPGWRRSNVVGLLVTQRTATKGVRESLSRSRWPMGFVSCSSDGIVQQMIWNAKAEEEGLAGLGVGVRLSETGSTQELVLTWKGQPTLAT
ncbi:putative Restriction endonuclease type IV Mrr domain-containing protein [Seiridium cardinale]|uniref:Restriction endonuclease type IV Mrr domain-containing protein n=1 Tax=Seiridium cardinale TaxID=138064 RepID=A0ABR2XBW8_9PEZI